MGMKNDEVNVVVAVVDEKRTTTKVRMVYDASSKQNGCVSLKFWKQDLP